MQVRVRTLVAALTAAIAFGLVPVATASPAGAAAEAVPVTDWAASFCTSFAPYVTNGFAAQQALDGASKATDATAASSATAVVTAMKTASTVGDRRGEGDDRERRPGRQERRRRSRKALGDAVPGVEQGVRRRGEDRGVVPGQREEAAEGGQFARRQHLHPARQARARRPRSTSSTRRATVQKAVEGNPTCAAATQATSSTTTTTPTTTP